MGRTSGRAGVTVAIVLSVLWALPASGLIVVGVMLLLSGRESDTTVDVEGFAEFIGGSLAVAGAIVLASAAAGILLGVMLRRGRTGARIGLTLLFGLFAAVSGMFLASAFADESGVDPGGVAAFGLNPALCLAVVVLALAARPSR